MLSNRPGLQQSETRTGSWLALRKDQLNSKDSIPIV
jgi:hypothetical protein